MQNFIIPSKIYKEIGLYFSQVVCYADLEYKKKNYVIIYLITMSRTTCYKRYFESESKRVWKHWVSYNRNQPKSYYFSSFTFLLMNCIIATP